MSLVGFGGITLCPDTSAYLHRAWNSSALAALGIDDNILASALAIAIFEKAVLKATPAASAACLAINCVYESL